MTAVTLAAPWLNYFDPKCQCSVGLDSGQNEIVRQAWLRRLPLQFDRQYEVVFSAQNLLQGRCWHFDREDFGRTIGVGRILEPPDLLAVYRNSVTLPIAPCFHIGGVENESDLFGIRIDPGLSKGKFQAVANIVGVLENPALFPSWYLPAIKRILVIASAPCGESLTPRLHVKQWQCARVLPARSS